MLVYNEEITKLTDINIKLIKILQKLSCQYGRRICKKNAPPKIRCIWVRCALVSYK